MIDAIVGGILAFLGLGLFLVSKSIFLPLPVGSPFTWVFALCSLVGLGLILFSALFFVRRAPPN